MKQYLDEREKFCVFNLEKGKKIKKGKVKQKFLFTY